MKGWKRFAIGATSAITLVIVSTLAVAVSTAGSGSLRTVAGGVARLLATGPAIDASAGGGVASGTGGATVSVGPTATLTDRILIQGTLTFSCGPLLGFGSGFASGQGFVQVQQAAGREIAFAGGQFSVTCDGLTHTIPYGATSFNLTFHPGGAVAEARYGTNFDICGFNPVTFQFQCVSAVSGGTPITILAR
jgi:hypothetical protein